MNNLVRKIIILCCFFMVKTYGQDGPSTYYKTNPTLGKKSTTAVVVDGNPQEWTSDMLIVQGVANDDARTFRGPHEAPVYDLYQLYATWDATNLYLMWQLVNVADITSPEQGYPNSDNGKPWNGDIPFQLVFDIESGVGSNGMLSGKTLEGQKDSHIWGVYNVFDSNEVDKILMFSSKPGVGQPGVFSLNASGAFDYASVALFSNAGVTYKWGDYSVPNTIYGINSDQHRGFVPSQLTDVSKYVDFNTLGHKKSFDTVYEMKIPLTALGIDANYLETSGIGVLLVSTFGQSGINSLPFDSSTLNNADKPYSSDTSSSMEKEDVDHFTTTFARIGKEKGAAIVRPVLTVSPVGGKYIGGTEVTLTASGEKQPIKIHYTLDGTIPTASSSFVSSGGKVLIPATNTTLKAVAIDVDGVSSIVATHVYQTQEVQSGIVIRFKDTAGWGKANIYAWKGTNTELLGAWPGKPMVALAGGWFEYVFEAGVTDFNIVINGGSGKQTPDIKGITSDKCYDATGAVITCANLNVPTFENNTLTFYPNPVKDRLIIQSEKKIQAIAIIDSNGKTLKMVKESVVALTDLASGIYIVKVIFEDQTTVFKRILKN